MGTVGRTLESDKGQRAKTQDEAFWDYREVVPRGASLPELISLTCREKRNTQQHVEDQGGAVSWEGGRDRWCQGEGSGTRVEGKLLRG